MKKIMILGASILQLPAIEKAVQMGLDVIVVDMNPQAVGFTVPGVVKEVISTIDTPAILQAAKRHHINGIITLATDMPMQAVAAVSQELGLAGITMDTALKATNKSMMRNALRDAGVPVPMYFSVNCKTAFIEAVKTIWQAGCNCIVKPADSSGSRGVDLLTSESNLEKAYDYTVHYSRNGEIMVEEFMKGPEVSVETLAYDGEVHVIQITDKITTGAPFFVEMGHSQPSQLSDSVLESISRVATAANKAIGIKNGPSHTEMIVTDEGPKIVELGARLGGDCITTHLVPLSTGVDMVASTIKIALGDKPDIKRKWNKGSAIRYLDPLFGTIISINGIEQAKLSEDVVQVSLVHNIGDKLEGVKNSIDRAGFVITNSVDARKAIKAAELAKSLIIIEVEGNV